MAHSFVLRVLGLFGLGVVACIAQASPAHDYLVRLQQRSGAPGVSAAVAVRGKVVFSEGVGVAELEQGSAQTRNTVHNVGSISKVETTVAVMQLVEQGKVSLDAEIQTYAPWFPRASKPVTLRHILTHTSGIRHYQDGDFAQGNTSTLRHYDSFEESTRFWRNDPLLFEPGTYFSYSSFAFNLLQAVVEKASGEPFEKYMRGHVWDPAGMRDSQFDVPDRVTPHRGRAYVRDEATKQFKNARAEDVSYKYAAGGMLATDEDLCRFGHALNGGTLLKPQTVAEMYRLQLSPQLQIFAVEPKVGVIPPGSVQALGFRISKDAHGRVRAGHSGSVKGTVTQFYNYFKDDVTVAVYMNFDADDVDLAQAAEDLAGLFYPAKGS